MRSDPFAGMASTLATRLSEERAQREESMRQSKRASLPEIANPQGLTPIQCAVINRVIEGKSSECIGEELGVSFKTVNSHLDRIKQKLKVDSKLMAALEWDRWARTQP